MLSGFIVLLSKLCQPPTGVQRWKTQNSFLAPLASFNTGTSEKRDPRYWDCTLLLLIPTDLPAVTVAKFSSLTCWLLPRLPLKVISWIAQGEMTKKTHLLQQRTKPIIRINRNKMTSKGIRKLISLTPVKKKKKKEMTYVHIMVCISQILNTSVCGAV